MQNWGITLNKLAPLRHPIIRKPKLILTNSHRFSCNVRQLHPIISSFDWFAGLSLKFDFDSGQLWHDWGHLYGKCYDVFNFVRLKHYENNNVNEYNGCVPLCYNSFFSFWSLFTKQRCQKTTFCLRILTKMKFDGHFLKFLFRISTSDTLCSSCPWVIGQLNESKFLQDS